MGLEYERLKYKVLKEMFDNYKAELLANREIALDMPIETDNGFNVERETLIDDIDEKLEILKRHIDDPYFAKLIFKDNDDGEEFNGYIGDLAWENYLQKTIAKLLIGVHLYLTCTIMEDWEILVIMH